MIAAGERTEQVREAERKHVTAFQAAPDLAQSDDAFSSGIEGEERAVDGPGRSADDEVGALTRLDQRLQHPDLHRAEAAAARHDDGGLS